MKIEWVDVRVHSTLNNSISFQVYIHTRSDRLEEVSAVNAERNPTHTFHFLLNNLEMIPMILCAEMPKQEKTWTKKNQFWLLPQTKTQFAVSPDEKIIYAFCLSAQTLVNSLKTNFQMDHVKKSQVWRWDCGFNREHAVLKGARVLWNRVKGICLSTSLDTNRAYGESNVGNTFKVLMKLFTVFNLQERCVMEIYNLFLISG